MGLQDDIVFTASSFVKNLSNIGCFDYSLHSLEMVDTYLEELRQYELDKVALYNITSMTGCYIFETARRNYGGEYQWIKEEQQPILTAGLPYFSVSICAWEKVRGRLIHGKEDSILFYIAGYKEHIEKGTKEKGYTATII